MPPRSPTLQCTSKLLRCPTLPSGYPYTEAAGVLEAGHVALRLDIQQSLWPTIAGAVRKAGLAAAVVADGPDAAAVVIEQQVRVPRGD